MLCSEVVWCACMCVFCDIIMSKLRLSKCCCGVLHHTPRKSTQHHITIATQHITTDSTQKIKTRQTPFNTQYQNTTQYNTLQGTTTHTHTHNMIIRAHTGTDLHIHNPTQHNMHTIQHTQHTTTNAYTCTQRAHFTQHTSQHSTPAHSTTRHNMQQKSPQVAARVRVLCGVVCCGWGVF